jgi:hypothetical protein
MTISLTLVGRVVEGVLKTTKMQALVGSNHSLRHILKTGRRLSVSPYLRQGVSVRDQLADTMTATACIEHINWLHIFAKVSVIRVLITDLEQRS